MSEHQDKVPETETTEALNKARALQIAKIMGKDEAEVFQYLSEINGSLQEQSENYFVKGCLSDMFAFELGPRSDETKYASEYKKLPQSSAEIYEWPIEETIGNLRAACCL